MILLQLSAAQGPAECCLAVAHALEMLLAEARGRGLNAAHVEQEDGPERGTIRSVLLSLDGEGAGLFAEGWTGSHLWVSPSPYRPGHKRKNWYFGAQCFETPPSFDASGIRFEFTRASGPGGQHVNTTASAVRAVHEATGIAVKVSTERSQHANRKLAVALIAAKLAELEAEAGQSARADRWRHHLAIERGNPKRVFRGPEFRPA